MPTTVGATRRSLAAASSTKWADKRYSSGDVTRQARSTSSGTATAATTARGAASPLTTPMATMTTSSTAHTAASTRRRRVQASGEVRPRSDRPSGPVATTAATTTPATGHGTDAAAAARATTASERVAGVDTHQRPAKRETDPAR